MSNTSTSNQQLNLARKWRPKNFDQVVGQHIAVRMLKNSLFLNKFFPVYLFAGQRGCGKTSTARIFAAAVNCQALAEFQKYPASHTIPCLTCSSCATMAAGNHPDFIEIDAASHTGVDNVRQIIESSSYMPLIGHKKIYLIDEAHMLSKAAFNAFLKILEEPPMSVLFILATTEIPKLPATVLSRCFQLIFNPIDTTNLKNHLRQICDQESVTIDDAALELLITETEGSARDAINLLERIRFSGDNISEQTVLDVLGKISNKDLFALFTYLFAQDASGMLEHLEAISFTQRSAQALWDMIVHLCRAIMWSKYGVKKLPAHFMNHREQLVSLAANCSINRLSSILNLLWSQEDMFLKTHKKHLFLEMVLLQICQQVNVSDLEDIINSCKSLSNSNDHHQQPPQTPSSKPLASSAQPHNETLQAPYEQSTKIAAPHLETRTPSASDPAWSEFQSRIAELQDPLLASIINQALFIKKDLSTGTITIQLSTESSFFKTKIDEAKPLWKPLLAELFTGCTTIEYSPAPRKPQPGAAPHHETPLASEQIPRQKFSDSNKSNYGAPFAAPAQGNDVLVIKDPAAWPRTSLILRYFSGKIKKVKAQTPSPST